MDPENFDPACHSRIRRKQGIDEAPMPAQGHEPPQWHDLGTDGMRACEPIVQNNGSATQAPRNQIEPDAPVSVAQYRMLAPAFVHYAQPGGHCGWIDRVLVGQLGRNRIDRQCPGIEAGVPDQPRVRRRDARILGESEAPRPGPPGWQHRWSACWQRRAIPRSPDRDAAIPTSFRPDRFWPASDRPPVLAKPWYRASRSLPSAGRKCG